MKYLLLTLLLSTPAFADEMYAVTEGKELITISDKACPNVSMASEYKQYAYVMDKEGTLHEGCWDRFFPPKEDLVPLVVIKFYTDNVTMSLSQRYFTDSKSLEDSRFNK